MIKKIFVNLPVQDVKRTMDFFGKLGFTFNKQFTDENAAAMVIGENMYAMLLRKEFFKSFIKKEIADSAKTTEVLTALEVGSKKEVDELLEKAKAAGGTIPKETQDLGFMYQRDFEDPDGHIWEIFWMDPNHVHKE